MMSRPYVEFQSDNLVQVGQNFFNARGVMAAIRQSVFSDINQAMKMLYNNIRAAITNNFRVRTGRTLDFILSTLNVYFEGDEIKVTCVNPTPRAQLSSKTEGWGPLYTPQFHGRQQILDRREKSALYKITGPFNNVQTILSLEVSNIISKMLSAQWRFSVTIKQGPLANLPFNAVRGPPYESFGIRNRFAIAHDPHIEYGENEFDEFMVSQYNYEGQLIKETTLGNWASYPRNRSKLPDPMPIITDYVEINKTESPSVIFWDAELQGDEVQLTINLRRALILQ